MYVDIAEQCTTYKVKLNKCDAALIEQLKNEYLVDTDANTVRLYKSTIHLLNIPNEAIIVNSIEVDYAFMHDLLIELIGNFPFYLVVSDNCKWNGEHGYMLCNDPIKTVLRNGDFDIIVIEKGKDAIKCIEQSNDTQTKTFSYIVGLTNSDYSLFSNFDLNDITNFAYSKF